MDLVRGHSLPNYFLIVMQSVFPVDNFRFKCILPPNADPTSIQNWGYSISENFPSRLPPNLANILTTESIPMKHDL